MVGLMKGLKELH
jgi:serine/threonine protein kinase